MNKGKVKIGMIQHACVSDKEHNMKTAERLIREAASKGAKVICTQELFNGQYFCQIIDVAQYDRAETVDGLTNQKISKLAKELDVVIVSCYYEYAMDGVYYNSAAVFDADGSLLGNYRKHHIPEGPQYIEKYYFTPGDSPYLVFKSKYATFGILICWDEWFPEPSRILAIKGADFIFYPSAIGSEPDNPDLDTSQTWMDGVKAHGIHNNMYVCAVNRIGKEEASDGSGSMTFYGRSFVSDPWGNIMKEGSRDKAEVIIAELDLDEIKRARDILQFHRDRRVDSYQEILKLSIKEN
ncbi:carbon-nitrogen hydrolase [Sinanaerobacter chloroacetimidivorans]|uniref:Carbon-nitrogen hydrolase n=1 Tax=Sinanaerobacter chloroacetimidivorans TaxID=2818044 RepID=A0A8J8B2J3_9FIRM|nr:carbon-nitrogen hydrolase [Sinanaerobacter chloroacetimidivorans]MBR0597310.1 carbon-nitrogen hydrolase [Sinanaerobacter chloroacetimidivorans]